MQDKYKEEKNIDLDSRKNPLMTLRTVKHYAQKEGLFSTPEHNDKLYLQYKGFTKIIPQTISQYHNLVALWLNNNSISKIEGLHHLINLTSLALNNNFISKIEGLQNLYNLSILNLSHNKIQTIQGLQALRKLQTINLSTNFIVHPQALAGITSCQNVHSIDLSHNQIENSEESFNQIILNKHVGCLYLKATPLARGFRNYRKKFIAALKNLKFLDDRPVLEKDHRLSQAWIEGGVELQETEKQKIAIQRQKRQEEEHEQRLIFQAQEQIKSRPQSFMADIKQTSIKIMNVEDQEEEEKIIKKYFQNQKEQIERNIKRKKEEEEKQQANMNYYQAHQTEVITEKVKQILGQDKEDEDEKRRSEKRLSDKWSQKYQKILQTLLLRYKFDFSQVQPSFNMIIANVNKKIMKTPVRFQIAELRKVWTQIEVLKRKELQP